MVLYHYTVGEEVREFVRFISALPIATDIAVSTGLVFALVQIVRFVSKEMFQRFYFKDELEMPTTRLLLLTDHFLSREDKLKIRSKIKSDFDLHLPDEHEELAHGIETRKNIAFAVSQIRKQLSGNQMVIRHNIEYGFVRNILGGCALALFMCVLDLTIFTWLKPSVVAQQVTLICTLIYSIPIVSSRYLMQRFGYYYAKILFEQYIH